jgi:signal transduction histidine kinase/ActR/RegA family two-component response regulator
VDYRVLLLAPTRRDREATQQLLERAGISSIACEGLRSLKREIESSVGAILMTDAVFADPYIDQLLVTLSHQPAWSDIPVILLCRTGPESQAAEKVVNALSNLTILERPTSSRTLLSSMQAALRARARQYELRDKFEEIRRTAAQLRTTEAALREADHRKDLFLATLAHELRNPLAPIRAAAQVLASPKLSLPQLQWAQNVIHRQVGHMALLLDDLLDVARITQGKLELKKTRVTLTDVVDSAVEAARPLIDSKQHQLTVTLPPEKLSFEADELRLSQVLSNLLTNAAKYTDPAGHIALSGTVHDGTLRLSVKDDGIGLSSEALTRIFEMFSQIESAATRSEGGLGLDLHGGTIEARSDGPGHGSEFTVRLPLNDDPPSLVPAEEPGSAASATAVHRVMIADDNQDAADSLAMLLELAGHEVRVARGGRAALSLARTFRPHVAIVDIGMPDLNGYEVARQLRREPWGAAISLVALTGWGRDDDRQQASDAGFDQHITKPVDPETIDGLLTATILSRHEN